MLSEADIDLQHTEGARVLAGSRDSERVLIDLTLEGAQRIAARIGPPHLILGDDLGRLLVFDVARARRITELRIDIAPSMKHSSKSS